MYGLLGKKLSHSFSKEIHETFYKAKYELIETDNLDQFFQSIPTKGINVTIPYKKAVIPYLDKLSTEAKEIGVVNCIITKDSERIGYNTDYYGLEKMLNFNNISVRDKTVVILGNGSTSRTISYYCRQNLAKKIIVLARNPKENEYNFSDLEEYKNAEIVFNSTPAGMFPNNTEDILIPLKELSNLNSVVDVVYNPLRTNLLIEANKLGKQTVNGLLMLIYQAIKSLELFHGITISDDLVIDYYNKLYKRKSNLVFIGMPMSGKSFLSKLCAKQYNKEFVDIDTKIEEYVNDTIPNIFLTQGEKYFRKIESQLTLEYAKRNNQAISCGGGVILNKENMVNLKQNGIIIFIDMPLKHLKRCNPKNRPLLQNMKNLERLYNDRYPLYKGYSDITIKKTTFNEKVTMRQIEVKINEYFSS